MFIMFIVKYLVLERSYLEIPQLLLQLIIFSEQLFSLSTALRTHTGQCDKLEFIYFMVL